LNVRPTVILNAVLLALALVAFGILATRTSTAPGIEVFRRDAPAGIDEMRVEVRGAVAHPGVYLVAPGDRASDAIALAGGPTAEASLDAVNLALHLHDEDIVRVPTRSEAATPLTDINAASQVLLEELPGIGPARAAAIIAARPYLSTDELVEREVIPAGVYEQIRELITIR
jgi:competence protein ComEA